MLIEAIKFEIRDFQTGNFEEFTIENTIENQERVFTHRFTRNIHFVKEFDFQFNKEMRIPSDFLGDFSDLELMLDPIDEMVGVFA